MTRAILRDRRTRPNQSRYVDLLRRSGCTTPHEGGRKHGRRFRPSVYNELEAHHASPTKYCRDLEVTLSATRIDGGPRSGGARFVCDFDGKTVQVIFDFEVDGRPGTRSTVGPARVKENPLFQKYFPASQRESFCTVWKVRVLAWGAGGRLTPLAVSARVPEEDVKRHW